MSEMTFFETYCKNPNSLCEQRQGCKEAVGKEDAERALEYAKGMPLSAAGDVLLFCAAANLMNAYVKQGDNKRTFGYRFKSLIPRMLDAVEMGSIAGASACSVRDRSMCVSIVSVCGLQFSFHCAPGGKNCRAGAS